jgi:hypothetical protein
MNYKQFYLIKERAFFTNLFKLTTLVLQELKNEIEKTGSVKPGKTYTVKLGDDYDLDIKFYKGYSKPALEYIKNYGVEKNFNALYFDKTQDQNGRIEVYINTSKKENNYYKERKFEDFVNKSLPKYIKNIISHELTHAYEDIVKDVLKYKPKYDVKDKKQYYNADEEMNAYITRYVYDVLKDTTDSSQAFKFYIKQKNLKSASREIFNFIKDTPFIKNLTRENKISVIKIIYTTVAELAEKGID